MSSLAAFAKWAREKWPNAAQRMQLGSQYAEVRKFELMLADLSLRNHVFTPAPDAENLFAAGVAEGRRRAVLELLQLVRIDPMKLASIPRRTEGDRDAA